MSNVTQEPDEYLTTAEVAALLKISVKTLRNKVSAGVFRKGIHYFKPEGLSPRFKWSAVQAWIEGDENQIDEGIAMRRGYTLNTPVSDTWKKQQKS
jgi:excisionase family DNA binding protein